MKIVPRPAISALLAATLIAAGCAKNGGENPTSSIPAPQRPVTNEYHGVQVTEDYQWLENAADPAVKKWSAAQNARARAYLDQRETRPLVQQQLNQWFAALSPDYSSLVWRAGRLFLLKFQPPAQQPVLVTLQSPNDPTNATVILDPNPLPPEGAVTIDWFVPSRDGKLVAVSLSGHGSEDGTLYLYDTATGTRLPDQIPRVQYPTAGGSAAWNEDGSGIFYTRYPAPGERPANDEHFFQQIYYHRLSTPVTQDSLELGKGLPRIAEIELESSPDGRHLLARVANGDGGEFAHYLRNPRGEWIQVTRFEDQVKRVEFGRDPLYLELGQADSLYLLSTRNAPRGQILQVKLSQPSLALARTKIVQTTNVITDFKPTASGMALVYLRGGTTRFVYRDFLNPELNGPGRGEDPANLGEPGDSRPPTSVGSLVVTHGDEVLFRTETYTEPFAWSRFDPNRNPQTAETTALKGTSPVAFVDIEAVRVHVKSRDGTRVPLTLIRKKGTRLTGDNPTLLTGYGGYGISLTPEFDFTRRIWFDQGGVLAIANLRGGSEFGESWHAAGSRTNKQNVFDDFAACADWLVNSNHTNPGKLALEGGSNGGLLMGAMLTQHPTAMQAVVSHVGIYDMLRVELDPNGEFNTTEFGSVKNADEFKALLGYSPYHHVQPGTHYPAVLMLTGDHDGRVNPSHSRKMTARLQAATTSPRPVLLRTSSTSGHGLGTSLNERVEQLADTYAFLFDQLGVDYSQVERGPLSGGVTATTATIKAKVRHEGLSVRVAWSTNAQLNAPTFTPPVISDTNHHAVVTFSLAHLQPDTQYYYALEVRGRLDRRTLGAFRTFPQPGPASFQIAFASCGRTGSTREVYERIRAHHPLFYLNMGDFHYQDIKTNQPALFRAAYDQVLGSPQQGDLYRALPLVYMWDDHDYGGNDANKKSKTHRAARDTYDEYIPHYPFAADDVHEPIHQSFVVGRVKFILTDLRSDRDASNARDDARKSMMGVAQKQWFKDELLASNGKYPLICWMSSVPWIGDRGKSPYASLKSDVWGYIHHSQSNLFNVRTNRAVASAGGEQDHWSAYTHERREIADFIKSNHISGVCILHGDSHMMAADDGSHSDYATQGGAPLPVMCAGPLDQNPSLKGGPYSQGVYRVRDSEGESGFGLLQITDRGNQIDVAYSGRNHRDVETISLKFSVPARPVGNQRPLNGP